MRQKVRVNPPNLDLTLSKLEAVGKIDATWAAKVFADIELPLKLH